MTKTLIETINSNVYYTTEALRFVSRDKVFVAWNGKRIEKFFKTKKSAETYVAKQQGSTYYDDYSQKLVSYSNGLMIDYVNASDLVDFYNDKSIWYKEMKNNRTHVNNMDMVIHEAKRLGVSDEVMVFLNDIRDEFAQHNTFTIAPEFEDDTRFVDAVTVEENGTEEILQEGANETVNVVENVTTENVEATTMTIEVVLNEERNGIELYFDGKPDENIRESLKSSGFRWSNRGKFWYAKQNDKTFNLVESLAGQKVDKENSNQKLDIASINSAELEDINIDDLEKYIVSDELQNSLHSNSMFNYDHQKECVTMFKAINDEAREIINSTDDKIMIHQVKQYIQGFKDRYYKQYIYMLHKQVSTPNWMVTGRGNLNVSRYNKKQEQLSNTIQKFVEMGDKHKKKMRKFKNKI